MHAARLRSPLALCLLAALGLGLAPRPALAAEAPDAWITLGVKTALLLEPFVVGPRIHVDTLDGRVVLYGEQPTDRSVQAAVRAARGVAGVREVVERIEVEAGEDLRPPPGRDDAAIRAAIEERLAAEPSLAEGGIEVLSVEEGAVTLGGRVESRADLHRALELAHGVEGVRSLDSEVAAPLLHSEDPFTVELEAARRALHGGDGEAEEAPPEATEGRSAARADERRPAARDARLTAAVKLRLRASEGVPARDVHVDTRGGRVVLFGAVPSEAARASAAAAAREVEGVASVANELRVSGGSG